MKQLYMKKRCSLLAFFMAALVLMCALPMQVSAAGASNSVSESGVTVTIETDKEKYKAGEEINYSIIIQNENKKWDINKFTLKYSNTEGINPTSEDSLPTDVPAIKAGESYTLTGSLIGDPELFVSSGLLGNPFFWVGIGVAVVVLALIIFLLSKGKKKSKIQAAALLLATFMLAEVLPAQAAVADVETITLRPYVKVMYAGQEIMVRAVMEIPMEQSFMTIEYEDRLNYQRITNHDPSIFRDLDGRYYIFGTHMGAGYTDDLYNWKDFSGDYKATYTEDTINKIRAWNKDESAKNWVDYLWAPDIIYNEAMGKYCIYLSANGDNWKSNIVLLTADDIEGPYDYVGSIVYGGFDESNFGQTDAPKVLGTDEVPQRYITNGIANRKWGDKWPNCIDPCVFYDDEGKLWMAYGSWSGGIFILELDENTGLRDYNVTYATDEHSDAYFGKKIAGGAYVSGEGAYIQQVGDYYYLFVSYGNLEAAGGYNVRIFRSEEPDGEYVDMLGNSSLFDEYVFNYNLSVGVRLMGGYKWRNFNSGQVAQGHNSAFVDADGRAYIVYHTRTSNGTEGHFVKVHQLFTTKEGWLVAAPYQTTGEKLSETGYSVEQIAGEYEMIIHEMDIDYKNLETKKPEFVTLNADGTITGAYEGTWSIEDGTSYIVLSFGGNNYSGVTLSMNIEYTSIETMVFTAVGLENQVTVWGSKAVD